MGKTSSKLPKGAQRAARRKLFYLDEAEDLRDVIASPGSRLEKLKGDMSSIRINDQWRICFKWSDDKAKNVEIVDYQGQEE